MNLHQDGTTYQLEPIHADMVHIRDSTQFIVGEVPLSPEKCFYTVYFMTKESTTPIRLLYDSSLLPEWMLYHIKLLDSAGSGVLVKGIGKKLGTVYWLGTKVI